MNKRLNRGCLVQLPDSTGAIRWHYRTRDLVCLSDGSLEHRGRADGYAKIGGKWVDVGALEAALRDAGCAEVAIVWHGDSQIRQAAVAARPGTAPQGTSWAAWLWKLRRRSQARCTSI